MSCRGVLFALTDAQVQELRERPGDRARLEHVQEDIEESWDREWLCETDKAWDAIHRCLTDGELLYENGEYPLNHAILGGESLYNGDDYVMRLKKPNHVRDVADALARFTEQQCRSVYSRLDKTDYDGPHDENDFGYTWSNLTDLVPFYRRAAEAGRWVLFTVNL